MMSPSACVELRYSENRTCSNYSKNKLTTKQEYITEDTLKNDSYDQVLINDPHYLRFVRKCEKKLGFTTPIIWFNVIYITSLFFLTAYLSIRILLFGQVKWQTVLYFYITIQMVGFGITGGVHRYWTHRSYKAKLPLQIILAVCYSMAGQNTIYDWVRDHRVHHKFSETSADPHNAKRGFFFSHVGWLMMKKHPDVIKKGNKINMSDIINDPIVKFHTKYFILLKIMFCWVMPCLPPIYLWNEHWSVAVVSQSLLRYLFTLNTTWAVNSFAHLWGTKPYDRNIMPSENAAVSAFTMGEGWHNYHHTFPWDYKASELGTHINTTTVLLNLFARISWAYDLKTASQDLIKTTVKKKSQTSHFN